MKILLADANVVITAQHFNPSVFSQLWLVRNGLATEEQVQGENCAYTNVFAQLITDQMVMQVTADHLRINLPPEGTNNETVIVSKLGRAVDLLPHTPFTAVGLNFTYRLTPEHRSIEKFGKDLFFVSHSPLHHLFQTDDSRFGGYLSKNTLGCRLRLEVKPSLFQVDGLAEHCILMNFNFHHELIGSDTAAAKIHASLSKWNEASIEARRIVGAVATTDVES
jgi:hypothetical protein